ncbi:unnamed protein product [Blepharisma stoltei]|uniref:Kinesin-like protein n=1 Tax=Blepharisma stoltei TaxID=1481888 RepID=A0AAU9JLY4_9CILI|nr:unnamed protein product [Blepharisma stoltei]
METTTHIGVVIRLRPLLPDEISSGHINSRINCDLLNQQITLSSPDMRQYKRFQFDQILDETVSQDEVFEKCNLELLIKKVIEGFNATIFAYGQTGSGKTFTMEGYQYDNSLKPIIKNDENIGITPRIIKALFNEIQAAPSHVEHTVYCTFIQIYKEKIYDLLNPAQLKAGNLGLKLRWNKQEEFYVENLCVHPCYSPQEVLSHYHAGLKNKIMAAHNLNSTSSRSHCLLSLTIEAVDTESGGILTSKLQLVDLAGSERVSLTGNEGLALKESIEINKSLFTLRQVITTLSNIKEGDGAHVPYRDSKLTSLLKQSIGGNSFCLMVACLAASDNYYEENLSTLAYASKAIGISNDPVKNIDPKSKLVKRLRKEIKELKNELSEAYQQIDLLSELAILEKGEQAVKLKEMENLPMRSNHMQRIHALRSNLESAQSNRAQTSHSLPISPPTAPVRSRDSEMHSSFIYTPEILSNKLHESVKMIRDEMDKNRRLNEEIRELESINKNQESEISHLQNENQELQERVENVESGIKDRENEKGSIEIMKLKQEREELEKRILQLESEHKQIQTVFQPVLKEKKEKPDLGWKSKRTIVRAQSPAPRQIIAFLGERPRDSGMNFQIKNAKGRPMGRVKMDKSFESTKPESQENSLDTSIKDEAFLALSHMLYKPKRHKYQYV